MIRPGSARALLVALLLPLAGCAAISSLNSASQSMTTFELAPAPGPGGQSGSRTILVQEAAATGALSTERIVVKPNPLQVTYLPGVRWVDPAPAHVQSLLVRSLANSGRVGFVGSDPSGPLPDYLLLPSIANFEAVIAPPSGAPAEVVIRVTLTLVRDIDARIVGSRTFTSTVAAADVDALTIVTAFDRAMTALLVEATDWTIATMARAPGA